MMRYTAEFGAEPMALAADPAGSARVRLVRRDYPADLDDLVAADRPYELEAMVIGGIMSAGYLHAVLAVLSRLFG